MGRGVARYSAAACEDEEGLARRRAATAEGGVALEDVDSAIRQAEVIVARHDDGDIVLYGRARLAQAIAGTPATSRALGLSFSSPDDLRGLKRRVKAVKDASPAASSGSAPSTRRLAARGSWPSTSTSRRSSRAGGKSGRSPARTGR